MADNRAPSEAEGSDYESDGPSPARKQEVIPDAVDHFLGCLLTGLQTRNIPEIHRLYETNFNQLTDRYYGKTKWPSAQAVQDTINSDEPLFLILYKELYYRHIYARLNPVTFEDRIGSWENYCKLLDFMVEGLAEGEDLPIALPAQWLWDILDEFVYHYQTYSTYCHKTAKMQKEKDVKEIREHPGNFATTTVLNYLHKLVRYSLIEEWLADPDNSSGRGGAFTDESTRLVGYFALMQLLRVHSLLGDYRLAMETIETIDFKAEVPLFYRIPACHVTIYYYMGFAYLMMRRYVDAIRTFSDILVFLSKTSGVNSLSYQYETMVKKQDQMYVLLLMCTALCPQPLDETLEKHIRDKHVDKQMRLQRGEESCFEDLFSYACPKFVSAAMPDLDSTEAFNANEAHQRQLHLFLQEVKQQQALPTIGSYMKLYTSLQTSKLAQLCEMDEEGLRDQLMCVMHKTRQLVRQGGAPLEGVLQACGEVEFYLDGDMVHINAQKAQRPHTDVFLEHILKFQDILKRMDK
jgi:translation initiation factor 3 subunit L